jgi:hypothetical protein
VLGRRGSKQLFPLEPLGPTRNVSAGTLKALRDELHDAARAALERPNVQAGLARTRFEICAIP